MCQYPWVKVSSGIGPGFYMVREIEGICAKSSSFKQHYLQNRAGYNKPTQPRPLRNCANHSIRNGLDGYPLCFPNSFFRKVSSRLGSEQEKSVLTRSVPLLQWNIMREEKLRFFSSGQEVVLLKAI